MMKKLVYKLLDPATMREISKYVREYVWAKELGSADDELLALISNISGGNIALFEHGATVSAEYKEKTRRLLECVREGYATPDEMNLVKRALILMSKKGNEQPKSLLGRRTYILALRYIAPKKMTIREIAWKLHIDRSNVYRDIDSGIDKLSIFLFGKDAFTRK